MEFFAMGKYGVYVWSCFGLTAAVLVFNEWRATRYQSEVMRKIRIAAHAREASK